jgi:hypothetical protein
MWLTGHPSGPPLAPRSAVIPALRAAARVAGALSPRGLEVDVGELLTGRAAWMGLRRSGRTSANGSCRLLRAADRWVAVNLARPSDLDAVPALIEESAAVTGDPWGALAAGVGRRPAATVVERATLLAVPAAALPPAAGSTVPEGPFRVSPRLGEAREPDGGDVLDRQRLVVDLSAMWAGPLCARLLGRAGFRVVKVESTARPDGARAGDPSFFSWLHAGHESVALDLRSDGGRRALGELLGRADVVVESSRPRALAQLGIEVEQVVAARPGVTWVSITGHGRRGAAASRVTFGDDAAVAAGLVAWDERAEPVFCGDAIADPITGLYAAVGALASQAAGGGHLLDVAMVEATRFATATPTAPTDPLSALPVPPAEPGGDRWEVPSSDGGPPQRVVPPAVPPELPTAARALGADTAAVLAELAAGGRPPGARTPC